MPPTPPPQNSGALLQHGLHHLVHHNSNTSYPQEHYDEGVHLQSNYGSPAPTQEDSYYRDHQPRYAYQDQHQDSGLGIQYDGYNPDFQAQMYQDQYSTPATSSPTPSMNSSEILRTRSGLGIQRAPQNLRPMPEGRSRVEKSPKPKKVKKEKIKAEKKVGKLEMPLSELTKEYTHVAILDIETYVNRSVEVRRKEVDEGKEPGKVKRPMNSFMLYRKAYQNRAKEWCLQNNHQMISQICGDSWPQEPDELREQFGEWSRIERINHANAHPGYKFTPKNSKNQDLKKSKRKQSADLSDESDLDDFEWQGGPNRKPKKQRQSPRIDEPVAYPTTRSAYQYSSRENSMEPNLGGYNRSSYQATNPGRPLPAQYNQAELQAGEYYQQTIQNHSSLVGVQDVIMKKAAAPGMHSYLGLPGGQEFNMMSHYPPFDVPHAEQRLDPSLLVHEQMLFNGQFGDPMNQNLYFGGSQNGDPQWQPSYEHDPAMPFLDPELTQDGGQIQDPHMHVLKGNQVGWHVESLDADDGEFNKWMDGE